RNSSSRCTRRGIPVTASKPLTSMARPGTAASRPANLTSDSARSDSGGSLSLEQKLELYYSPPLDDYMLPQTSDIVVAIRKLASY
ncbi:MAG TPA: hypothetical protein VF836_00690, partial [Gemmatimonadaceae bacterium]